MYQLRNFVAKYQNKSTEDGEHLVRYICGDIHILVMEKTFLYQNNRRNRLGVFINYLDDIGSDIDDTDDTDDKNITCFIRFDKKIGYMMDIRHDKNIQMRYITNKGYSNNSPIFHVTFNENSTILSIY